MAPGTKLAFAFLASASLIGTAAWAQTAMEGGVKFSVVLTDEAEVPGPGDPVATGTADIIINPGQRRVCWEIITDDVNPAFVEAAGSGAHIHPGDADEANPPIINLGVTLNGTDTGCVTVNNRALLMDIIKNPEEYYVNLHWRHPTDTSLNFSAGALRSQLDKAPLKSND